MTPEELNRLLHEQQPARFVQCFRFGELAITIPLKGTLFNNELEFSRATIEFKGESIEVKDIEARLFAFLKTLAESED